MFVCVCACVCVCVCVCVYVCVCVCVCVRERERGGRESEQIIHVSDYIHLLGNEVSFLLDVFGLTRKNVDLFLSKVVHFF